MSNKKQMTLVNYHVPEDSDDPQSPNIFAIPIAKAGLRLSHIYEYFPLKGTYVFRFKFSYDGFTVWLDLPDLESKIPLFKDKIHIKANRLSWQDSKLSLPLKSKQNQKASSKQPQQNSKELFNSDLTASVGPHKKQERHQSQQNTNHMNLLNSNNEGSSQNSIGINLLGPISSSIDPTNTIDFFGAVSSTQASSTSKKSIQINLMQSYQKHGDLI